MLITESQCKKVAVEEKLIGSWSIYDLDNTNIHTVNIKAVQQQRTEGDNKKIFNLTFDDTFVGADDPVVENLEGYFIDGNLYLGIIPNTPFVSEKYFYVFNMDKNNNFGRGILTFYGSIRCDPTTADPSQYSCEGEIDSESFESSAPQKIIKDDARITPNKIDYRDVAKRPPEFISSRKIKGIWELECREITTINGETTIGGLEKQSTITIEETGFKSSELKTFKFKYAPESETELSYDLLSGSINKDRLYLNVPSLEGIKQYFFRLNTEKVSDDFKIYAPSTIGYGYENINNSLGNCARQEDGSILCEELNGIEASQRSCRIKRY